MAESSHRDIGSSDAKTLELAEPVTVYWRPGCPSCALMLRGLRANEVAFEEVNIWDDPSGAATVRALAHGTETVPTVVVGTVALVNPSVAKVLTAISGATATGNRYTEHPRRLRRLTIGTILTASLFVDLWGRHSLSWALDGVAVDVYVTWRIVERWMARRLRVNSRSKVLQGRP